MTKTTMTTKTAATKAATALNDDYYNYADSGSKLEILLERKIAVATDGLQQQFIRKLKHVTTTDKIKK
jgi:hypothetical protein